MTLLYNHAKKSVENIPEDQVTEAVGSGQYAFRKGVTIPVLDTLGARYDMPAESAPEAFASGWRYETKQDSERYHTAKIAEEKAKAFDAPVTAALAGAARSASFGLSDAISSAAGFGEDLAALEKANPTASVVGEIAGALTPSAPIRGAAKLSEMAAARLLTKGTTSGKIASELVRKGAGSAVEGAFYGAGELVSEAALGDPNLTAENALATLGLNVIGGGVAGTLIPLGAKGISKAKEGLRSALVDSLNVPGRTGEAYAKVLSTLRVTKPEQKEILEEIFKAENAGVREKILAYSDDPMRMQKEAYDVVKGIDEVGKYEADILGKARSKARTKLERVKYLSGKEAIDDVQPVVDAIDNALMTATGKRQAAFKGYLAPDLELIKTNLLTDVSTAKNAADIHEFVHKARMDLDARFKPLKKDMSVEATETRNLVKGIRDNLQEFLYSEKMFKEIATDFKQADVAFSKYLSAKENFQKLFTDKVNTFGGPQRVLSEMKAGKFIKGGERAVQHEAAVADLQSAIKELSTTAASVSGIADHAATANIAMDSLQNKLDGLKDIRKAVRAMDALESYTGKSLYGAMGGMMLGTILGGGVAGTAAGLAGAALANPKTAMRYLVKLERGNVLASEAADSAAKKMFGRANAKSFEEVATRVRPITIKELVDDEDRENNQNEIDALRTRLQNEMDLQNSDMQMRAELPLMDEIAPSTYAAMVTKKAQVSEFLFNMLPAQNDAGAFPEPATMTDRQRAKFEHAATVAHFPGTIYKEMASGWINPETVTVLASLYPGLLNDIRTKVLDEIATDSKKIGYNQRLQLSKLLGIPTTANMQNMAAIQAAHVQQAAAQQPASNISAVKREMGSQEMSGADSLLTRRS
jgi:hypothetical protein